MARGAGTSNSSQKPCLAFSLASAALLSSCTRLSMLAALILVALRGWPGEDASLSRAQQTPQHLPPGQLPWPHTLSPGYWGPLALPTPEVKLTLGPKAPPGLWAYLLEMHHNPRLLHHGILPVALHQVSEGVEPFPTSYVILPIWLWGRQ